MASRIFQTTAAQFGRPLIAVGFGLGAAACLRQQLGFARPLRLDSSSGYSSPLARSFGSQDAQSEGSILTRRRLNPKVVRQISTGSILGVLAGLGVSIFSRPLAILLGFLIVGVQTAESYGIHLVPYKSIQRYVKGVDVRSALQDNVPLKISFGILFALTGFTEFSSNV